MEFKLLWTPVQFQDIMSSNGYRLNSKWPWYMNIGYGIPYGLLLPFMLLGVWVGISRKEKIVIIFTSIIIIHTIIHVFLAHVQWRYRIPIDSFVIILGIYGFKILWDNYSKYNRFVFYVPISKKII